MAVLRCAVAARGWGSLVRFLCVDSRQLVPAFDRAVLPLVERTVPDEEERRRIHATLLSTGVKVGFALWGYASMARVPFDAELSVLGSSFTRLYDDLVDHGDRAGLDGDLASLFAGGSFRPQSRLEELLLLLHDAIAVRLPHPPDDPIHPLLRELHAFQLRSRAQRDPRIPLPEVLEITRGKGGLGMVALLSLLRPRMPAEERALLTELGYVFQLLDDLHDLALDRAEGITTGATLRAFSLTDLAARIQRLRSRFRAHYGTASPLTAHLALTLVGAPLAARRRTGHHGRPRPRTGSLPLLFSRAGNIRPHAPGSTR
ncbi:hypothetical protein [Streptomyces muensis]|uniref:Uncharacterized protein n=1 Tax=Streptomyces muensis TaxID=1077944 RepID=A0A9X1PZP3_STRM4|nr:hypothetical protein [Streptomyces muensis]MCF1596432.1 hypothetical protein [Streptomyces muensis]